MAIVRALSVAAAGLILLVSVMKWHEQPVAPASQSKTSQAYLIPASGVLSTPQQFMQVAVVVVVAAHLLLIGIVGNTSDTQMQRTLPVAGSLILVSAHWTLLAAALMLAFAMQLRGRLMRALPVKVAADTE